MATLFVQCKVLPGLFDNEYLVSVLDASAFVSRSRVRVVNFDPNAKQAMDGSVLAYFVEQSKDRLLVELPGEPVVGGLRTWIPEELVVAA
jgi:CDP-diacylglycerol pyrophosphatase